MVRIVRIPRSVPKKKPTSTKADDTNHQRQSTVKRNDSQKSAANIPKNTVIHELGAGARLGPTPDVIYWLYRGATSRGKWFVIEIIQIEPSPASSFFLTVVYPY